MVDKISNYLLDHFLYRNEKIQGDQREIMIFGITRIVEDIPKYVIIFVIALLLNVLKEVGIVFLITVMYKSFVGGAHARTNIGCLISSLIYFLSPVIISKYFVMPTNIIYMLYILLLIFSIFIIVKIAPADTEEIPVINKGKRKQMKLLAFISLTLIYAFAIFFRSDLRIIQTILITVFCINCFTMKPFYRLFKCKYSYESDEFKEYFN